MKRWIAIFFCLVLAACNEPLSHDESTAIKELLKIAPIGSDVKAAMPKLEDKGFKCSWQKQEQFAGIAGKHDYLYCDIKKVVNLFVERRWQLAIVHKDFIVTDAKVRIDFTGL